MKNERLIQKREEFNFTQVQAAKIIGISQSMLSKAENGERNLDDVNKVKLAQLYKTTVEWLFFENMYNQKSYKNSTTFPLSSF